MLVFVNSFNGTKTVLQFFSIPVSLKLQVGNLNTFFIPAIETNA